MQEINKFINYNEMQNFLVNILKPQYPWLEDVSAPVLQQVLIDLEKAYRAFFKSKGSINKPKFKKKHWRQSARFPQYVDLDKDKKLLYLPKCRNNPIKIILERDLPEFTMVTIVKESDDNYYACFFIEKENVEHKYNEDLSHVGLDLGLKDLLTLSTGETIKAPRLYRQEEPNISRKNRALAKKTKGSRRWLKCKKRLSRAHVKVKRRRLDFIHQLAHKLANNDKIQGISVETLSSSIMMKNSKLSKSISDASWYLLMRTLKYKLEMKGKTLTFCSSTYPSTQTCSKCNLITGPKGLSKLNIREWTCNFCGENHNRDINAAKNIAAQGNFLYHGEHKALKGLKTEHQ